MLLPLLAVLANPSVDDLAWMTGTWRCEIWGGQFEETWTRPEGGTMMGTGRLIVDGKTTFMEFMSVQPGEDGLTMWITLGDPAAPERRTVPFRLTEITKLSATFENPKNEFPSRIRYERRGERLYCRIDGKSGDEARMAQFDFRPAR
jgi:hypothetical protein